MTHGMGLRAPATTTPTHSYGRFSTPTGNFNSVPITTSLLDGPVPLEVYLGQGIEERLDLIRPSRPDHFVMQEARCGFTPDDFTDTHSPEIKNYRIIAMVLKFLQTLRKS